MENSILALLPTICIFCRRLGPMICQRCSYDFLMVDGPVCLMCQRPSLNGITHKICLTSNSPLQLFSPFAYEGKVRRAIKHSKYEPYEYGAIEELTIYGIKQALSVGFYLSGFLVVPVPLSKKKLKLRGFNQSVLIAKHLANYFGLKMDVSNLIRIKDTSLQADLDKEERKKNLSNVFVANPKIFKGEKVLLVDDICTTGATLTECSKALYSAGAIEVRCFTISRVANNSKHSEGKAPRNAL